MSKNCYLCKMKTIFYIWSTSRDFPINSLMEKINNKTKQMEMSFKYEGVPVCFNCYKELKMNE